MEPLVKSYLKNHTFQQLEDEHGVCARPSSSGDKFSLNYDQIMVKNGDVLAEQCRGMVIRPLEYLCINCVNAFTEQGWKNVVVGDVEVLAWPMDRFYNHGDVSGADVDWEDPTLKVYEKLDGTMIVVYWDQLQNRWHAGTRSVPEADLPIMKDHIEIGNMTFSQLFLLALKATHEAFEGKPLAHKPMVFVDDVINLDKELTYVFELTTPFNRIVVKYDEPRVTLLAVRHTATGKEVPIESIGLHHVPRPLTWNLRTPSRLESFVNSADPAMLEGAVVCDSNFRRLKIKNKAWVLSSKAKDLVTVSRRSALLAIINGQIDDVMPLVDKDIANEFAKMQLQLRTYLSSVDKKYDEFKSNASGSRKDFAIQVMRSGDWSTPYFNMWEGKASSAFEWVQSSAASGKISDNTLDLVLEKMNQVRI